MEQLVNCTVQSSIKHDELSSYESNKVNNVHQGAGLIHCHRSIGPTAHPPRPVLGKPGESAQQSAAEPQDVDAVGQALVALEGGHPAAHLAGGGHLASLAVRNVVGSPSNYQGPELLKGKRRISSGKFKEP